MLLKHIIDIIESAAPKGQQEAWDNSGLQVGNRNAEIHAALLTVDVTESVVGEAISIGCDLIVSHHPLIFHGIKSLDGSTPVVRCVETAIKNGIAIYSAHTSIDCSMNGVSGRMATELGITDYTILAPMGDGYGLGVVGDLPHAYDPMSFLCFVKNRFGAELLRYTDPSTPAIRRVALCGGSGAEFAEAAIAAGAEAFITADMKYHEMQNASGRILAVSMDHWTSEHFTRDIFAELLTGKITTYISKADKSPVRLL